MLSDRLTQLAVFYSGLVIIMCVSSSVLLFLSRGQHGGFGTVATRHATHTTQNNTLKRCPKRLRSHSNSKLDPRNDTRKVKKLGPRPYELTPHAHTRCLHPSARHRMLSTVSDATGQEGNDYVQGCSGTRGNSRARPCGTHARRQLALAHVCKGWAANPRRS